MQKSLQLLPKLWQLVKIKPIKQIMRNVTRARDPWETDAVLYQLSYEANLEPALRTLFHGLQKNKNRIVKNIMTHIFCWSFQNLWRYF